MLMSLSVTKLDYFCLGLLLLSLLVKGLHLKLDLKLSNLRLKFYVGNHRNHHRGPQRNWRHDFHQQTCCLHLHYTNCHSRHYTDPGNILDDCKSCHHFEVRDRWFEFLNRSFSLFDSHLDSNLN
jgi:hypothetical protein